MDNVKRLETGLFYTDEEILIQYREAADKKEQIKILAQLNLCTEKEIRSALVRAGLDFRNLPRSSKKDKENNTTKIDDNHNQGHVELTDVKITASDSDNSDILHNQLNDVDEAKVFSDVLCKYIKSLEHRKVLTSDKIIQFESELKDAKNELINIDQQLDVLNNLLILLSTTN